MIEQGKGSGARGAQAMVEAVRTAGAPAVLRAAGAPAAGQRIVSGQDWQAFKEQAGFFIKSGLLPSGVVTIEAALTIMVTGYELGIGPMQALRLISVVQGKPVCAAELMAALVYRDHGDDALRVEESTAQQCAVSYKRRGWSERRSYTFSMADATTAGLASKGTWKSFPAAMLRARCISAVARMAFPDTISGLYTPEEIAPDGVRVTEQGEVILDPDVASEQAGGAREQAQEQAQEQAPRREQDAVAMRQADEREGAEARSAADWTREQLGARIRQLSGNPLEGLGDWAELARDYERPAPQRWVDMTQPWVLALYQSIRAHDYQDRITFASTQQEVITAVMSALSDADTRHISMEQYHALRAQGEARKAELASPLLAGSAQKVAS